MSEDTVNLFTSYIQSNFLRRGINVSLDFFGGEPLLSLGMIKSISRRLKSVAEKQGREYTFYLVTNGTLLSAEVVRSLVPLGLKGVRVTLDGPPKNHDIFRPFVSGGGSFDLITRNLFDIQGLTEIGICGNFSRDNYRCFPELLDIISDRGLTPEVVSHVIFAPITGTLGKHIIPEFSEGCISACEPWLMEAGIFLREEILRRGYVTPRVGPTVCMIESRHSLVVHFDGNLYKCPAFISFDGFCVGDLKTGIRDYRKSQNLDAWKQYLCLDCVYLPLCFGGCRFLKYLRDGDLSGVECRREYFDATLEAFVRQDLQYLCRKKI